MATQSGASSSPHQRWRPAPQAAEEHKEEEEKNRKFKEAKTSGPQGYQPRLGPFVTVLRKPSVNKTGSAGESERGPSTFTRRGADNAPEATRGPQHVPPSSTKASSAGANSDAQRPAAERTSSQPGDSQSTRRTTTARTVSFDDRPSDSPMSTSSVPPGRPQPPQERTPPRPLSTDKTTRSQKATVESDVDEDATDSEAEKGSNRPPASMAHTLVSTKAVVDDTSGSEETAEEQPMRREREHRPYSQPYVNERIAVRPPNNTTPTSDGTPSTRQEMELNNDRPTPEVQAQRESFRQMQEEERQRDQARARELQEQREREKKRQEMEARDRELAKQLQEAEQRKHFQQMREAEKREGLRQKQEAEQRERSRQGREDESRDRAQRMKKEQEEFARRAEEAKSRHQERKRTEDDEKERERWRRATGASSSSRTPYSGGAGGGTSSFPRSPPPFDSFGSGFPASPARFSSAGSASTQNVAAEWDKYDKAWTALTALGDNAPPAQLQWRDIPWPMAAQPLKSADLDNGAIANFVLSPTHSQIKSPKERIREALLRWHPDRFESRWLPKCAEKDREEIKAGVGFVICCLNDLLKPPDRNASLGFTSNRA